jgi:histidyl-tRNA synthetase
MRIKTLRGMHDILPGDTAAWQDAEDKSKSIFELFGYREIRTPVLESTALFTKSIGDSTDIVQKEMYSFTDRGGRDISLRPEGTAPIVRSYIENGLDKKYNPAKLYYIGPMFRAERPQAGRYRQFYQIGVEAIGSSSEYLDAEIILMLKSALDAVGLKHYEIQLNTLGCSEDKKKYSATLKKFFARTEARLCEDCKARAKNNPLRVLDCKRESCRALAREAPDVGGIMCDDCKAHFDNLKDILKSMGVDYAVTDNLVRGLDYYTRTTFEVVCKGLGSKDAVAAGGRYDNLIKDLGGPDMPACGFAIGQERLMQALGSEIYELPQCAVYIAALGAPAKKEAFKLLCELREAGKRSEMDYDDKSLKAKLRAAARMKARYAVIIGEEEIGKNSATVKNMEDGSQEDMPFDKTASYLKKRI